MQRWLILLIGSLAGPALAEPPVASYIFPAGARLGTETEVRVGGLYFHGEAGFEMQGSGIEASPKVTGTETIWFEGPLIHQPLSQKSESYPKDHVGTVKITGDAPLGLRKWHCRTSQGITASMPFVVGDLPEIVEREIDGEPIAETVTLPLTINGRIFPREDVDLWEFEAAAGETIVCEVTSQRLGYPLEAVLAITGPDGRAVPFSKSLTGNDPTAWFKATAAGIYQVRINDARFSGLQDFIYRLTIRNSPQAAHVFPLGGKRGETVQVEVTGPGLDQPQTFPISLANATGDFITAPVGIGGKPAGPITLHVGDWPEFAESAEALPIPSTANGRINAPGEIDSWAIDLGEKQTVLLEVEAAKLGSRLESFLTVCGSDGKELAKNDDGTPGQPDSRLVFTSPKAGRYTVKVKDQFDSRGGPGFGYRLHVSDQDPIDFRLTLNKDAFTVRRDDPNAPELSEDEAKLAQRAKRKRGTGLLVTLETLGAFKSDVVLEVGGLPDGVSVAEDLLTLPFKKKSVELFFDAKPNIPVQLAGITVRGTATIVEGDKKKGEEVKTWTITRDAIIPVRFGESPAEKVRFAVAPHVPFKHRGLYRVTTDRPGGSTWVKHYEIDRGGFEGPITVQLADHQIRHLQGTRGPDLTLAPGESEFDYPIKYLANPEVGRTCRVQLMISGEMTDFDGSKHRVSYTSAERSEQIITVTTEGLLRVSTSAKSYPAAPGDKIEIPVRIQRASSVTGKPVRVELIVPEHIRGVRAEKLDLAPDQESGKLVLEMGDNAGPMNLPLTVRSYTISSDDAFDPDGHVGETEIELVPPLETAAR